MPIGTRPASLLIPLLTAALLAAAPPRDEPWVGKRVVTNYGTVLKVGRQVVDDEGRGKYLARGEATTRTFRSIA